MKANRDNIVYTTISKDEDHIVVAISTPTTTSNHRIHSHSYIHMHGYRSYLDNRAIYYRLSISNDPPPPYHHHFPRRACSTGGGMHLSKQPSYHTYIHTYEYSVTMLICRTYITYTEFLAINNERLNRVYRGDYSVAPRTTRTIRVTISRIVYFLLWHCMIIGIFSNQGSVDRYRYRYAE